METKAKKILAILISGIMIFQIFFPSLIVLANEEDEEATVITASIEECDWTKEAVNVELSFSDSLLNGYRYTGFKYAITNSEEKPATLEEGGIQQNSTLTIDSDGQKYLHIEAYYSGNYGAVEPIDKVYGPFKIDLSNPKLEKNHELDEDDPENRIHSIVFTASDEVSGVNSFKVKVNNGEEINIEENEYTVRKNGIYEFEVVDNAGNKITESFDIRNIYKECNKGLNHPDYESTLEKCPICDKVDSIEITEEEKIYNGENQGITYNNPNNLKIKEYYNNSLEKPFDVGEYEYRLEIEIGEGEDAVDYNTGLTGTFKINPKKVNISGYKLVEKEYDSSKTATVDKTNGITEGIIDADKDLIKFTIDDNVEYTELGTGEKVAVLTRDEEYKLETVNDSIDANVLNRYYLDETLTLSGNITKKEVQLVNFRLEDKVYDGNDEVNIIKGSTDGIFENDDDYLEFNMINNKAKYNNLETGEKEITLTRGEDYELKVKKGLGLEYNYLEQCYDLPETLTVKGMLNKKELNLNGVFSLNEKNYDGTTTVEVNKSNIEEIENQIIEEDKAYIEFVINDNVKYDDANAGENKTATLVAGTDYFLKIKDDVEEKENYEYLLNCYKLPEQLILTGKVNKQKLKLVGYTISDSGNGKAAIEAGEIEGLIKKDENFVELFVIDEKEYDNPETAEQVTLTYANNDYYLKLKNGIFETFNYIIDNYEFDSSITIKGTGNQIEVALYGYKLKPRVYDGTTEATLINGVVRGLVQDDMNKIVLHINADKIVYDTADAGSKEIILRRDDGDYSLEIKEGTNADESILDKYVLPETLSLKGNIAVKSIDLRGRYKLKDKVYDGINETEIEKVGDISTLFAEADRNFIDIEMPEKAEYEDMRCGEKTVTLKIGDDYNLVVKNEADESILDNYALYPNELSLKGTLEKKKVTVNNISLNDKVYDGTNIAYLEGGETEDILDDDRDFIKLQVNETANYDNIFPGNKVVTLNENQEYKLVLTDINDEEHSYLIDNYEIDNKQISLEGVVSKRKIELTDYSLRNKVYDGTKSVVIEKGTITGIIDNDADKMEVKVIGTAEYADSLAGEEKEITLNAGEEYYINLKDENAEDIRDCYEFAQASIVLKGNVAKAKINLKNCELEEKEYDGTKNVKFKIGIIDGIVESDLEKIHLNKKEYVEYNDANVENNKQIQLTAGEDYWVDVKQDSYEELKNCYEIKQQTLTLAGNIVKAKISLDNFKLANKVYDGNKNATIMPGEIKGIAECDANKVEIKFEENLQYENENAGENKTIELIAGEDYWIDVKNSTDNNLKDNYELKQERLVLSGNINPKAVDLEEYKLKDKEYDKNNEFEIVKGTINGILDQDADYIDLSIPSTVTADITTDGEITAVLTKGQDYRLALKENVNNELNYKVDNYVIRQETLSLKGNLATTNYQIKYNNVKEKENQNPVQYSLRDENINLLPLADDDEYKFGGWYSDEDYTNKVETIDTSSAKEIELYAKWEDKEAPVVKVKQNPNDGENYIYNITPNIDINIFNKEIDKVVSGDIKLCDKDETQVVINEDTKIATGMKIIVTKDGEEQKYNLVVKGDIGGNADGKAIGDGEADITDLVYIRQHIQKLFTINNKVKPFSETQLLAGDINGDGEVDIADLVLVRRHIQKLEVIK